MPIPRHLIVYAPPAFAAALASFGGVYVFTRLLGPEDYGRYALLLSVLALVHTASLTASEAAAYRFAGAARTPADKRNHAATILSLHWRGALAAWGLILALAWVFRDAPAYLAAIPWIALVIPLNGLVQSALETHRAERRVGRYSLVSTTRALVGFALGAALAAKSGLGPAAPFAGLAAAGLLAAFSEGAWLAKRARGGTASPERRRAWIGYGAPLAAALILDLVLSASDRFLIAWFLDEAAVGAYAAGYGVADKTVLMICAWAAMGASPLLLAAYERGGAAAAEAPARRLIHTLLAFGVPAATGLALVAEPLADAMIAAPLRDEAAQIIPWIAFAGLLNGLMIHYASEAFLLTQRTGLRAGLMVVPAGANVALNLALIPAFGLPGAVTATLVSYLIGLVVLGGFGRTLVRLPLASFGLLRILAASLAMWPAILVVPNLGGWLELIAKTLVGALVYSAVAIGLDILGLRSAILRIFHWSDRRRPA